LDAVSAALNGAGLVLLETITNPLCRVPDVEAIVGIAKERGVPVLVDNTFATPILCRPIELGADVVMHSATKYIGGHPHLLLRPAGAGAMLAVDLAGGRAAVQRMMKRFRMVSFAASLGGVETTISYPEITSHRGLSPAERAELGVGSGTVRVSTGIEAVEDIV